MQRRVLTLVAVAMLAIGLAACGSSGNNSSSSGSQTTAGSNGAAGAPDTITIQNFKFTPLTVKPGATVTVKNLDSTTHTVTADKGEWNTGDLNGGSSATFTAPTTPGTYGYHCNIHSFMRGTLTVAA